MYAYRVKFIGDGVFMHKKKDGGIACQKLSWFGLAGPLAGPSGGRPGQSGGAAELLFCKGFRRVVESA
jgi:hypothetical protein